MEEALLSRSGHLCAGSSDKILIGAHKSKSGPVQRRFSPPPPSATSDSKEVVDLTENGDTLKKLMHFAHKTQYPDIFDFSEDELFDVAHAAEKYVVYPALGACSLYIRSTFKAYPAKALAYSVKHHYPIIADVAAPLTLGNTQEVMKGVLNEAGLYAWYKTTYVERIYSILYRQGPSSKTWALPLRAFGCYSWDRYFPEVQKAIPQPSYEYLTQNVGSALSGLFAKEKDSCNSGAYGRSQARLPHKPLHPNSDTDLPVKREARICHNLPSSTFESEYGLGLFWDRYLPEWLCPLPNGTTRKIQNSPLSSCHLHLHCVPLTYPKRIAMPQAAKPSQILSRAGEGCPQSLWRLHDDVAPDYRTEEVVEVAFKHLEAEIVPATPISGTSGINEAVERALPSVLILYRIAKASQANQRMKETFARRMTTEVYAFCLWNLFLFDNRLVFREGDGERAILAYADRLRDLMGVGVPCWMLCKGPGPDLAMESRTERDILWSVCPLIDCVVKTLAHEAGRERFTEAMSSEGYTSQKLFLLAIIGRIHRLDLSQPGRLLGNFHHLIRIADYLIVQSSALYRPLEKAGYIALVGETFHKVFDTVSNHPSFPTIAQDASQFLLNSLFYFINSVTLFPSHTAHAVRDTIATGILPLLVRLAARVSPKNDATLGRFKCCIDYIGWYMYRRSVFEQLKIAEFPAEADASVRAMPVIGLEWASFTHVIESMVKMGRNVSFGQVNLCDYPSVSFDIACLKLFRSSLAESSAMEFREMVSKLRRMHIRRVLLLHMPEARLGRETQDGVQVRPYPPLRYAFSLPTSFLQSRILTLTCVAHRSKGTGYSQATRSYHARLMARFYGILYSRGQADVDKLQENLPLHQALPCLYLNSSRALKAVKPLVASDIQRGSNVRANEEWWDTLGSGEKSYPYKVAQTWLRPRLYQLYQRYLDAGPGNETVRLMEGSFYWTERFMVIHTLMFMKDAYGNFIPRYCISRHAELPATTKRPSPPSE
ncbi:hypothetical protein NMY22_g9152 [Coprinellus aureogranulatus]|nr:hypothetical protein NMY22_g9152 [Coprinellus aureogranulatus]